MKCFCSSDKTQTLPLGALGVYFQIAFNLIILWTIVLLIARIQCDFIQQEETSVFKSHRYRLSNGNRC